MKEKVVLSIEKSIYKKVQAYATQSGQSLSKLVEAYLASVVRDHENLKPDDLPPKLRALFGVAQIPNSVNHKKEMRSILSSKHKS